MHILVCDDDAAFAARMDEYILGMVPRPGDSGAEHRLHQR